MLNFHDAIERARQAGACQHALERLAAMKGWEDFARSSHAPDWALWYVTEVAGRTPELEPIIARTPRTAYTYARFVLEDRWPMGEPAILRDAETASLYACHIIRDRWPEAEPVIATSAREASNYACYVLKRRWPEAEPVIARNAYAAIEYFEHFRNFFTGQRWREAEPAIASYPEVAEEYAQYVVFGPGAGPIDDLVGTEKFQEYETLVDFLWDTKGINA